MSLTLQQKLTLHRYPIDLATNQIAHYKEVARGMRIPEDKIIKAYLVSYKDIAETLGIPVLEGEAPAFRDMRVYLGALEVEANGVTLTEFKLFLVPVDEEGRDRIPRDEDGNEFVYDFNVPCPNTCDSKSKLYKAGELPIL